MNFGNEERKRLEQAEAVLKEHSEALSAARKQFAGELVEKIADGLRELNFLDVQFEMEFRRLDHFTAGGIDEPEFLISTNPGEPIRPLGMVASGGELSRIMLAIKTVLAETDQVPTLILMRLTPVSAGGLHRWYRRSCGSSPNAVRSSASRTCRRSRRWRTSTSRSANPRPMDGRQPPSAP